ncbi:MAG: ABC transporter substrate-binding protein [Pseudonocardiaceae bacterium]
MTTAIALVVSALVATVVWVMIETIGACGTFGSGVKQIDGECVGVTDGSYVFLPELAEVEQKIAQENARVRQESSSYVTVAVLDPLASAPPGIALPPGVLRNRLEGAYTALRRVNAPAVGDSGPSIQLVLASQGSTGSQWGHVRDQLVAMTNQDNPLVAVVGLGVSSRQTVRQVTELSEQGIPMIGAWLSADTLNYDRSPGLIRTSPSNKDYVAALGEYVDLTDLKSAVTVVDANPEDIFVQTLENDFKRRMNDLKNLSTLRFAGTAVPGDASPVLFSGVTADICSARPDAVLYAGRPIDFSRFLESLENRSCVHDPVTVLTAGIDLGKVLEAQEDDLRAANLTVVIASTVNVDGWRLNAPGTPRYYQDFVSEFQRFGFDPGHLDETDAIMMHDALLTAGQAVELAAASRPSVTAGTVLDQLLNLNGAAAVQGASGRLSFSSESSGDPVGKPVPVLQYPPPSPGTSRQVALYTVER